MIAAVNGPYNLDSIKRACSGTDAEIILVQAGNSEQEMRLEGIRQATGERIAVIGDRYELGESWIRVATSAGDTSITGCVTPPAQLSWSGWAIYLAEYSHVAPPMQRHAIGSDSPTPVTAGNIVYSRAAGASVNFDPDLAVSFARPPALKQYLVERFRDSRAWAIERSKGPGRYVNAAARLILPLLLLWRRAHNVFTRKRYRGEFLGALPLLAVFGLVETAGEISGFLSGGMKRK